MNKFSLSFDLNTFVIITLLIIASVAVFYIYKNTRPKLNTRNRQILIIIRSLVIILFILLISIPTLLHYHIESEDYIYTLLIDRSKSTDNYAEKIDSIIVDFTTLTEQEKIRYQIIEFNQAPNNNFTDIYAATETIVKISDQDKVFLISDGNHNSRKSFEIPRQQVYTIPIGRTFDLQKKLAIASFKISKKQSLMTTDFAQIQVQHSQSSDPITLELYKNDSLVYRNTFNVEGQLSILNPDLYFNQTGLHQIKVIVRQSGVKISQIRKVFVSDNRTRVAYLFDQPNLECRFFLNQLSTDKYLIDYLPIKSAKTIDHDLIVVSIQTIKHKAKFIDIIEQSNQAVVIFTQVDLVLNQTGLTIKVGNKTNSSEFRVNKSIPSLYASFFVKNNLATTILPKIMHRKMTITGKRLQAYPLFESTEMPIQLVRKNSVNRFLLFSSIDFWRLHFEMQNEVSGRSIYKEFVNYYTRLILTGSKKVIQLSLNRNDLYSANHLNYSIKTVYPDGQAVIYDQLNIETYHNGQLISERNLPNNSTGIYKNNLTVPDSGLIEIRLKTIVQSTVQYRRSYLLNIQNRIDESLNEAINRSTLQEISDATGAELIEADRLITRNDLFQVQHTELLKSNLIKLYFEPLLLILLITLISVEFWLRKQNKLL